MPRDPEELGKAIADRLAEQGITAQPLGGLSFELKLPDGNTITAHFDNIVRSCEPGLEVEAALAAIERLRAPSVPLEVGQIVPVVRSATLVEGMVDQAVTQRRLVVEPLVGDLRVLYVQDLPNTLRYLFHEDLDEVGLGTAGLRKLALDNLLKQLTVEVHEGEGFQMITAGGNFEASLLLWDDLWERLEAKATAGGDLVAFVPARDLLFVTTSQSVLGMSRLAAILTDPATPRLAYPLSQGIWRRTNGRWIPYEPDEDDAPIEPNGAVDEWSRAWQLTTGAHLVLATTASWLAYAWSVDPSLPSQLACAIPGALLIIVWMRAQYRLDERPLLRVVQQGLTSIVAFQIAFVWGTAASGGLAVGLPAAYILLPLSPIALVVQIHRLWKGDGWLWQPPDEPSE